MLTCSAATGLERWQETPLIVLGMVALDAAQTLVPVESANGIQQTIDHHHAHSQALGMHRLYQSPAIQVGIIAVMS